MTPLPKRRWSTHRQGRKRATLKAISGTFSKCPKCGELRENHCACKKCGYYKDKIVIKVRTKKAKVENQE